MKQTNAGEATVLQALMQTMQMNVAHEFDGRNVQLTDERLEVAAINRSRDGSARRLSAVANFCSKMKLWNLD